MCVSGSLAVRSVQGLIRLITKTQTVLPSLTLVDNFRLRVAGFHVLSTNDTREWVADIQYGLPPLSDRALCFIRI